MNSKTLRADAMMLFAAMIWGTGFVAQRLGMDHVGPLTFTAARFALGAAALFPLVWYGSRRGADRSVLPLRQGLLAGVALFAAASVQQAGMIYSEAGTAGFITGTYVLFVPLLGWFLGHRPDGVMWFATPLCVLGLYLLSTTGVASFHRGDLLVLCCAVLWAVHVLVLAKVAPNSEPFGLAMIQFAVTAGLAAMSALFLEPISVETFTEAGPAIAYSGLLSVGVAFTMQVLAQRSAAATHVAVLMSMESVFAALAGALLLDESLTPSQLLGCAVMLAAMLIAQLVPVLRERRVSAGAPCR